MKTNEWEKLSQRERNRIAVQLHNSIRGAFIISQALYYAIETMKKVPQPHTEESNIEDMEILREQLYPMFFPISEEDLKKLKDIKE